MKISEFEKNINCIFKPFLNSLGFSGPDIKASGRIYRAVFMSINKAVSITLEPMDNYCNVILFNKNGDSLSDIDNPIESPRISDLNKIYQKTITAEERLENIKYFALLPIKDIDKQFLKFAQDLRLIMLKMDHVQTTI